MQKLWASQYQQRGGNTGCLRSLMTAGLDYITDANLLQQFRYWNVICLADYFSPEVPSTSRSKIMHDNIPAYELWRAGSDEWMQMDFIFCISSTTIPVALCNALVVGQNSLIEGLPDNNVAPPAEKRACQPASRIEVNKPKCMYMLPDRLLSAQQGSSSTDLLKASLKSSVSTTVRVLAIQTHSLKEDRSCAPAFKC